jgi:dienelactone hydrolase
MSAKRLTKRFLKGLAALVLLASVALIFLFASLYGEHKTPISLPEPTGNFAVGRTTYTWINDAETDELAPSSREKRYVLVWIWYPAETSASAPPADYLPAAWRLADEQHSSILLTRFLTHDLSLVQTHSRSDPDVSSQQHSYPVVILRAGGGAYTTDFTTLAEDLASHGYVVVGFDAPYRTRLVVLPDNRVIERPPTANPENLDAGKAHRLINRLLPMWTADTKFVVAQLEQLNSASSGKLAGHLDMHRLGMFGHSFGGATTLQFCHDDARCKAGIDIDGAPYGSVVREGLKQPFMFILSDHSREVSDPESGQIGANIHSIYDRLPDGRFFITIRGAHHFSFSDQVLLKSHVLMKVLTTVGGLGKLDGRRGLAITTASVHTFFDVYLKGAPPTLLSALSAQYPEVQPGPR